MNDENEQGNAAAKKRRWRRWTRRREITTGKFPPQGGWRNWSPDGPPFGDDQLSENKKWIGRNQTADREFDIRPEPDEEKDS